MRKIVVYHIEVDPPGGVWTVIKNLSAQQKLDNQFEPRWLFVCRRGTCIQKYRDTANEYGIRLETITQILC